MGINMVILCGTVVTMPHPYGQGSNRWRNCRMFIMDVEGEHVPVFIQQRDYRLISQPILEIFRMKGRLKIHGIIESDNVTSQMRIFVDNVFPDKEGQDRNDTYVSGIVQGSWKMSDKKYITIGIADGRVFSCLTGLLLYRGSIDKNRQYAFVGRVRVTENNCVLPEFFDGCVQISSKEGEGIFDGF